MDTSRYAELFLTESRDNLSAINHSLLELERSPDAADHVGALFRAVHTVKGMSATMGYSAVAELSHEMETLLELVRRGDRRVSVEMMDTLFEAADALELAIELSVAERGGEVDIVPLVMRLRGFAAAANGAPTARAPTIDPAVDATDQPSEVPVAAVPGERGVLVRVRQVQDTPLRGARAFLVVQRAGTLGEVTELSPSLSALQEERYDRDFWMRILTSAPDPEIERAIRSAGHVERVTIEREAESTAAPERAGDAYRLAMRTAAPVLEGGWASETTAAQQHRHVRIDLRRLDAMMNLIGELVITRGRLVQLTTALGDPAIEETIAQASRLISDLQDGIMTSRMVPVWQVFDRFPRVVRDAARSLGKQIDFTIVGKEIELDRSMLDELGDPVIHMLRNAIDHGIESPAGRIAAGKPATGRVSLSALRDRSSVVIRVSDDGCGMDRELILARARSAGLVDQQRTELSDDELLRVIAHPGFSMAARVTDLSGRGVGIDAVQSRVRALGGTLELRTVKGMGTTITLRLPVTLAILRALLARVNGETYALPMTHVSETVNVEDGGLRRVKGRDVLVLRDDVLPLLHLRDLLQLPRRDARGSQVVVLEVGDRRAGLVVDELTGQQEIVVKPYDAVRGGLQLFSGATILGDGIPALILDVSSLL